MPIMDLLPLSLTTSTSSSVDLKLYKHQQQQHRSTSSAGTPPSGAGSGPTTIANPQSNGSASSGGSGGSGTGGTDKRIERRKPNWTECENVLLLDQFSLHAELLTCKATDASTNLRKQEVWRIICQNLNRQNSLVRRTPAEVRRKWKNLVTAAKKEVWEIRHQVHLTGGAAVRRISELSQRVLQLHSSGGESSSSSAAAAAAAAASLFLASGGHHLNNHNHGGSDDYYEAKLKLEALSNSLSGYYRSGTSTPVHHPIVQLNEQSTPSIGDEDDYCCDDVDDEDDRGVDNNNNNGNRRHRGARDSEDDGDDDDGARSMMSCSPSDSLLRHAPGSNEFDSGIYEEDAPHDLRVNKPHGMMMLNGHGHGHGHGNAVHTLATMNAYSLAAQANGLHAIVNGGLNGGVKNPYSQKSISALQTQLNLARKSSEELMLLHSKAKNGGTGASARVVDSSGGATAPALPRPSSSASAGEGVGEDLLRTRLELQIDVLRLRKRRMEIELRRLLRFPSIGKTRARIGSAAAGGAGAGAAAAGESSWWRKRYRNYLNNHTSKDSNRNSNGNGDSVNDSPAADKDVK